MRTAKQIAEYKRAWYFRNREEQLARCKERREGPLRETILKNKREYYEKNKRAILQKHKAYRDANRATIRSRHRIWWSKNKHEISRRRRARRVNDPVVRAKEAERSRRWFVENRQRAHALHRKWKARNPEKMREYQRRWALKNPEYKTAKSLSDCYVKTLIANGSPISARDIPKSLIALKRAELKLKRKIREQK